MISSETYKELNDLVRKTENDLNNQNNKIEMKIEEPIEINVNYDQISKDISPK